jgi:hypothetical protein
LQNMGGRDGKDRKLCGNARCRLFDRSDRAAAAVADSERRTIAQCTERSAELADGPPRLQQQPPLAGSKRSTANTIKDLKLKFCSRSAAPGTGGVMRGKEESTPLVDDRVHVCRRYLDR